MRLFFVLLVAILLSSSAAYAQALQTGDRISISVYQDPKLDRELVIDQSGKISFPLAGRVRAAGLTPEDLERNLRNKLKDKYTSAPDITVSVIAPAKVDEDAKPRIFVTGEVTRPGTYPFTPGTDVVQAIAMSGGLGPYAARGRIQVRRKENGSDATFVFNYSAFESGKENSSDGNIELKPGDVVIVPEKGLFE
ncbi:MAG: polysaccharide biosynthesis/export family protein [Hyphomicrobium sp.]|uniref:polysaccharide biosynthesis/export family protein n=1 Tax=Hyphomicrobium sp. TaxID=82 RepID=UPI0039E62AA2